MKERPKRVVLILKRLDARGGAEAMGRVLIQMIAALGHDPSIIARKGPAPANLRFVRVDPFHLGRIGRYTGFARAARRACHALAADVIYSREHVPGCHIYHAGGGAHAEMFHQTRRAEAPLKRFLDRWHPYHRSRLRLERRMYASPELRAVICNSAMVRDDIQRRFGLAPGMLHVVENGIDTARYRGGPEAVARRAALRAQLGLGDDELVLLFVGSGFHRKGLGVAIRALAGAQSSAHLVVVGRDRAARGFRRLAQRLGVARRVHFVGNQPDVRGWYWMADVLIHPALYEAYGLVIAEAMAAGRPVIASTRCGSALSLVIEGETGYLADALDVPAFARAIDALSGRGHRTALGAAATIRAEDNDIRVMRERFTTLLDDLIVQVSQRAASTPANG